MALGAVARDDVNLNIPIYFLLFISSNIKLGQENLYRLTCVIFEWGERGALLPVNGFH